MTHPRAPLAAVAGALCAALVGCDDRAVVVEIRGDLAVPVGLDGLCVAVGAEGRSRFGQRYRLGEGALAALPQTLTLLPGGLAEAELVVRGSARGVEVARARRRLAFGGGVSTEALSLDLCPAEAPTGAGFVSALGAAGAGTRAALLETGAGPRVAALAGGTARLLALADGALVDTGAAAPAAPAAVRELLAFDADGDCDDDLLVLAEGAVPALWLTGPDGALSDSGAALLGGDAVAAAAGDLDGDGDLDLVVVDAAGAVHALSATGARFDEVPGAFDPPPADADAVAVADLDGDLALDVVIGAGRAAGAPNAVYLGTVGATALTLATGALAPVAERTRTLSIADLEGDGDLDLVVVNDGAPLRVYRNRGNAVLDDVTAEAMAGAGAPMVRSAALADVDRDCARDLVMVGIDGQALLLGNGGEAGFQALALPPGMAAIDRAEVVDLDGDGDADLLLAGGAAGVVALVQQ